MSHQIFYRKAFISIGDKFVPIVNSGASNCTELDDFGREVLEMNWYVLNQPMPDRFVFSANEIQTIASHYEEINQSNPGLLCHGPYKPFQKYGMQKWVLAGMKSAFTVEEYVKYGNQLLAVNDKGILAQIHTTEELLKVLKKYSKNKHLQLEFRHNRCLNRPSRSTQAELKSDLAANDFYVIKGKSGYLCKVDVVSEGYIYGLNVSEYVKKFKTILDVERYLKRYRKILNCFKLKIELVQSNKRA